MNRYCASRPCCLRASCMILSDWSAATSCRWRHCDGDISLALGVVCVVSATATGTLPAMATANAAPDRERARNLRMLGSLQVDADVLRFGEESQRIHAALAAD